MRSSGQRTIHNASMQQLQGPHRPYRIGHAGCKNVGVQWVRWHSRPGRQCSKKHPVRGEVFAVRPRERVLAVNRAAEPGILPAQGREKRVDGGGMNTGSPDYY